MGTWFDQNAPSVGTAIGTAIGGNQNTGVTGGQQSASPQTTQGGDPHDEFMQAVQALGIDPKSFRSNPAIMDKVTQYLSQKYPGQNWTNGGQRAGDWVSMNGQGFDVLPAGDANWQWLSDPAGSTAWSGGDTGGYGFAANGLTPTQQIEQTPGYQFSVDQAMNAIQHSAAAKGTLLSGGLMKNLGSYIANSVAGPAYQQQVGNLYNLAGLGQNAAALSGNAGANYGRSASDLLTGIGNAQAGATVAGGNAYANAATGIGNTAAQIYAAQHQPNPYQANASGYNPNGVNGYGVNYVNPNSGGGG
jgi:hypothetical protein